MIRRRLFTVASLLSLLLCLGLIVACFRSFRVADSLNWRYGYGDWGGNSFRHEEIGIGHGGISMYHRLRLQGRTVVFSGAALGVPYGWTFRWQQFPASGTDTYYVIPLEKSGGVQVFDYRLAGFQVGGDEIRARFGFIDSRQWLVVPFWALIGVTAVLPAMYCRRIVVRRRRLCRGFCISCDYNLTSNTSGVCPECGTPTTVAANMLSATFGRRE